MKTQIAIGIVLLLSGSSFARAGLIDVCLAANGGDLVVGPESIRDGDFSTAAQNINAQSGNIQSTIVFPDTTVQQVTYRISGEACEYDGGATSDLNVLLRINGAWSPIFHWYGTGWQAYNPGVTTDNNGGAGWTHVSGIQMYSSVWGSDTGSGLAAHYEMQVWALPEPSTLTLAAIAMMAIGFALRRRQQIQPNG
jgi:hypothetical protein